MVTAGIKVVAWRFKISHHRWVSLFRSRIWNHENTDRSVTIWPMHQTRGSNCFSGIPRVCPFRNWMNYVTGFSFRTLMLLLSVRPDGCTSQTGAPNIGQLYTAALKITEDLASCYWSDVIFVMPLPSIGLQFLMDTSCMWDFQVLQDP